MTINDLKKLQEAPTKGYRLIYTRKKVIFGEYDSIDKAFNDAREDILEIHLFDEQKEYRAVSSDSKRFESGVIEHISDFPDINDLDVYMEECFLEEGGKLKVLNHIQYDNNTNMAYIDDYRLFRG